MKNVQYWTREMEKQLAYRVNVLLNDPQLLSVWQTFGRDVLRRSSALHGLDDFMRAKGIRGDTCFEVGTWAGITAVILSRYFRRVVTVDIVHHPQKLPILKHLGITNVECIDIDSEADKARIVRDLGRSLDFAYLDGDHHARTESDFDAVKHCGRVMFQEVFPWQSPVWELVHSLPQAEISTGGFGFALWNGRK